jgi:hypothetical protein
VISARRTHSSRHWHDIIGDPALGDAILNRLPKAEVRHNKSLGESKNAAKLLRKAAHFVPYPTRIGLLGFNGIFGILVRTIQDP